MDIVFCDAGGEQPPAGLTLTDFKNTCSSRGHLRVDTKRGRAAGITRKTQLSFQAREVGKVPADQALPFAPVTDKPPAFAPPSTPAPPKGAYLQSWDTQARFYKGRDPPSQTRRSAPASDPRRGSPVLGTSAGTGVGELTRVAGLGSRFRTVRFDSWGLGVATLPGVRRNPFSGEPTLQPPRLRLEKGERRERDWHSGAGSPEPGGGGWSPPPGGGRHGRPRTPVAGRSPNPVCPHPGRSAPRTGARAPGSARLHLRIWGAAPRRLPGPPSRSPGSRRAVPSLEKDPGVTQRGRLPGKGRLPARGARGAAGKRRLRCAGSGPAERPAAPPAPTSSSSARPRHSAPLPGSAAPGPPLPAPRCGLRRREQRVSRPASPLPRGEKDTSLFFIFRDPQV
ncbi:basic proline-rich protein [Equus quagga]|uniref:basic proline-rich protein n=1 Tax=Equus quagga TaxID=89248 RepID=UPI001EE33523|nr:basic proline-rich protein [Equus quagga]